MAAASPGPSPNRIVSQGGWEEDSPKKSEADEGGRIWETLTDNSVNGLNYHANLPITTHGVDRFTICLLRGLYLTIRRGGGRRGKSVIFLKLDDRSNLSSLSEFLND